MKLHLGCGNHIREGWINMDIRPLAGVDVVRDILRGIPFADNTFSEVYSENFLEHLPQTEAIWVMNEIWRVLHPQGRATHLVPEAGSTNFWQDPTHLSHWVRETFTYFEQGHRRNIYYGDAIRAWIVNVERRDSDSMLIVEMVK